MLHLKRQSELSGNTKRVNEESPRLERGHKVNGAEVTELVATPICVQNLERFFPHQRNGHPFVIRRDDKWHK